MPINLTMVNDDSSGAYSKRRRRHHRHRRLRHMLVAIGSGLGLFGLLTGVLLYIYWERWKPRRYDFTNDPNSHVPKWTRPNHAMSEDNKPQGEKVTPVLAESSGELPRHIAKAHLHKLRRVIGGDKDSLQLEYEFFDKLEPPYKHVIIVRTPNGVARVNFSKDAALTDVVELSMTLSRLGSRGPIEVWIESLFPGEVRVSNIMTLP